MSLEVEVKNVEKNYGNYKALNSVSLHVNNGEFLTILGPSGSGKTTLLKIISGFEFPSSGSVWIGNKEVTNTPPHLRGIGMVFQNYALFPHMTVYENIQFPLSMRKIPKKEVHEKVLHALELIQLSDFKNYYPGQLSGGQKQRVALARAIVFDPPVLLLDEPLGALDKQLRTQMQLEIKKLQEKLKITTISVTHDQEEALTMSTRICIINKGQIEQVGTPIEIYENPVNRFIANFIGETNLIDGQVMEVTKDEVLVKSNRGELIRIIQPNQNLKHNHKATLAIRPEVINIDSSNIPVENQFHGVVKEVVYMGDSVRCKVLTEKGDSLNIKVNSMENSSIQTGQKLLIGWGKNNGTLLTREEAI
ncbi:ABC transporter ATP-binding protein [Bacillus sp. FJAT-29790]|uniref:ABC transporter ATP-binding protein n=1 Tax=Bacillus sp. FJAT-29790 TaxID=1895002 RepID=UPI0020B32814|nr:ABC transporter ATP-binding protein [Bacillus sp. FJAT-29790]